MADLSLDELLSSSLKSAAEPAPSAGVADLIRSRVAAGETGTSAAGSTAPGWTGGASGIVGWLPWIGAVIATGAIGATIGALGYAGHPIETVRADDSALVNSSLLAEAPFAACPGGEAVGSLPAGSHVLAVQRDESSANLGVRDPYDVSATIWLPAALVSPDDAQPAISSLPVGDPCPTATIQTQTPTPQPTQTTPPTQPTKPPSTPPAPPKDTTPPKINTMTANPTLIINDQATTITVTAGDDVKVTTVKISWSSPGANGVSGSASMTKSGSSWVFSYSNSNLNTGMGNITFTAKARDAAGNQSPTASVVVNRQYLG